MPCNMSSTILTPYNTLDNNKLINNLLYFILDFGENHHL